MFVNISVCQLNHAVYVAEVQWCDYCSALKHNISNIDHSSVKHNDVIRQGNLRTHKCQFMCDNS